MNNPIDYTKLDFNYGLLLKEIALRDIEMQMVEHSAICFVKQNGKEEMIFDSMLSSASYTAAWIAADKYYSKKFLQHIGVPTPTGKVFPPSASTEMVKYAKSLSYPVVIKPLFASHGLHVYSNIENEDELVCIVNFLKDNHAEEQLLLLEEHIPGEEFRLFVTANGFFAAVNRRPASVIGDGEHTIQELMDRENFRRMNPRDSCLCTLKIDDVMLQYLAKQNRTLDDVPSLGEKVTLRLSSNVAMGGECVDVTDIVHDSVREFAFHILSSLTGTKLLGIDLICEDITQPLSEQKHGVCELNCVPGFSLHTLPSSGTSRNSAAAVADLLFSYDTK